MLSAKSADDMKRSKRSFKDNGPLVFRAAWPSVVGLSAMRQLAGGAPPAQSKSTQLRSVPFALYGALGLAEASEGLLFKL